MKEIDRLLKQLLINLRGINAYICLISELFHIYLRPYISTNFNSITTSNLIDFENFIYD